MQNNHKIIEEFIFKNPHLNNSQISRQLFNEGKTGYTYRTLRSIVTDIRKLNNIKSPGRDSTPKQKVKIDENALYEKVKKALNKPRTIIELANEFDQSPKAIENIINTLKDQKYNIKKNNNEYELSATIKQGGNQLIDLTKYKNKSYKIGVVSDNHLNSKYERLDVLNAVYDIFDEEGITEVYNAGNWVDGEARFNKYDLINTGITPQIKYFVEKYPQRKGITTYFVAGDDHEGWWVQREKIDIGKYTEMEAEKAGRTDLKYLGYIEADVELKAKKGSAKMKIMHPGGGSAYALSYSPQKMIESFQGGEKPHVLVLGHYHKADYIYYRDVHCIQAGCTCDQTPFLRKKKIQVSLGGWILEFEQSEDGAINRMKTEWLTFYNKDYYKKNWYYK